MSVEATFRYEVLELEAEATAAGDSETIMVGRDAVEAAVVSAESAAAAVERGASDASADAGTVGPFEVPPAEGVVLCEGEPRAAAEEEELEARTGLGEEGDGGFGEGDNGVTE